MYDGTAGSVWVFRWSLPTSQQIAGRSLHVGAPPGRNIVGGSINEALPDSACSAGRQPGQTPRVPGQAPGLLVMMIN